MSNYQIQGYELWWRTHELATGGVIQTLKNYADTDQDTPKNRRKAYETYVQRMNQTIGVLHKTQPMKNSVIKNTPDVIKMKSK